MPSGPLLASAHAELARQLATVPAGKQGAAIAVLDQDGAFAVSWATRIGEDWAVGAELAGMLSDPKAATAKVIVAGSW
jgi:hypothetical protein